MFYTAITGRLINNLSANLYSIQILFQMNFAIFCPRSTTDVSFEKHPNSQRQLAEIELDMTDKCDEMPVMNNIIRKVIFKGLDVSKLPDGQQQVLKKKAKK